MHVHPYLTVKANCASIVSTAWLIKDLIGSNIQDSPNDRQDCAQVFLVWDFSAGCRCFAKDKKLCITSWAVWKSLSFSKPILLLLCMLHPIEDAWERLHRCSDSEIERNCLPGAALTVDNPSKMYVDPNTEYSNVLRILADVSEQDEAAFKFCLCPFNPSQTHHEESWDFNLFPILPASAPGKFLLPYFSATMQHLYDMKYRSDFQVISAKFCMLFKTCEASHCSAERR